MGQSTFWQRAREASAAVSAVFNGQPRGLRKDNSPASLSPSQRGVALGNGPGVLSSDHLNELQHFKSWVYVAVDAIARQWEQSDWKVYDASWQDQRGGPKGKSASRFKSVTHNGPAEQRTPADGHPVDRLLKRPNEFKSRRAFLYQVALQLHLTGGCVIYDVRDQFGEPSELWVIPRGWMWPLPPSPRLPLGGWRVTPMLSAQAGWYQNIPGRWAGGFELDARETIQVYRAHPLFPGEGTSPLDACSQLLDIMFQLDASTFTAFVNAPKPSMLVTVVDQTGQSSGPQVEEQVASIRAQLETFAAAGVNGFRALIGNNISATPLLSGPQELDYVNGRDQSMKAVLSIFGVPPIAIGQDSDGTYSGAAAKMNQFSELTIRPGLALFAGEVTHRFSKIYGEDLEIEGTPRRYDDPDLAIRKGQLLTTFYAMRRGDVRISENEARAVIELEPIDGGDVYPVPKEQVEQQQAQMQAQVTPGGATPPGGAPPGDAPDLDVGDVGGAAGDDASADPALDLDPLPPDDESTGVRQPFKRAKALISNGHANGAILNGHGGAQ